MDHKELRSKVNSALKRPALSSLVPERGKRITNGLSSGSMMLNLALSGSPLIGYTWGTMAEIYGPESAGKTTLALHAVLEAQILERQSQVSIPVLFEDAENALDTWYAENMGIELDNLSLSQPECAEDALNEMEAALKAGYKLIVVDSVAALVPRAEVEGEAGESHVGLHARLMSQAMRKLNGLCSRQQAIILWVNQIREKVGIMFGNPEVTTGGRALKFYAIYRIEVKAPRKGAKQKTLMGYGEKEETVELGIKVNAKVNKNKVFPPHRRADFFVEYGKGIDRRKDAIDFLVYAGAFKKTGKSKNPVMSIPSKKKSYSASALLKLMGDSGVQKDVIARVKEFDSGEAV